MVLPTGQDVIQRMPADNTNSFPQQGISIETTALHVDMHPARAGQVAEIGQQPVADVAHRGRTEVGQLRTQRVRRRRPQVRLDQRLDRHPAVPQQGQACGRPAKPTGQHHPVARLRTCPGHRRPPAEVTQSGHADDDAFAGHHVAADDDRPDQGRFVAQAIGQVGRPGDRQVRWRRESHQQRRSGSAHRCDVGEVCGGGLAPHVVPGGPVEPEVDVLDEHIGRGDDPAVRSEHHGGVVARPKQDRRGGP